MYDAHIEFLTHRYTRDTSPSNSLVTRDSLDNVRITCKLLQDKKMTTALVDITKGGTRNKRMLSSKCRNQPGSIMLRQHTR